MILEGGNEQGSLDAGLKDTQDVNSFAKLHLDKAHLYSSRSGVHLPVHKVTVLSNSVSEDCCIGPWSGALPLVVDSATMEPL